MESGRKNISSVSLTNGVQAQPATTQQQPGRKIILVIDDNLVFQKAMLMKLRSRGYDVMTAEDGSAAAGAMRRLKPDLILLDINFPPDVAHGGGVAWDGFLIIRWLRQACEIADVPV